MFSSSMNGGFFKRPKANGFCLIRDKCFALGTWVLAKWEALWRKFVYSHVWVSSFQSRELSPIGRGVGGCQ